MHDFINEINEQYFIILLNKRSVNEHVVNELNDFIKWIKFLSRNKLFKFYVYVIEEMVSRLIQFTTKHLLACYIFTTNLREYLWNRRDTFKDGDTFSPFRGTLLRSAAQRTISRVSLAESSSFLPPIPR